MYKILCVLFLAICLSQAVPQHIIPDVSLMRFMINSREASQGNPARSLTCFDYYLPILDEISEQYKVDYTKCLTDADVLRAGIDESTQPDRDLIEEASESACAALSKCQSYKGSIEYFNCSTNAGAANTKTMYTISANASEILAQVREQIRLIDNDQWVCTNKSERVFVETSDATYEEFRDCLFGINPVPDAKPTAAPTNEPTDSTTEEPINPTTVATTLDDTTQDDTTQDDTTLDDTTQDDSTTQISTTTEDDLPEEDLSRLAHQNPKQFEKIFNDFRHWIRRN